MTANSNRVGNSHQLLILYQLFLFQMSLAIFEPGLSRIKKAEISSIVDCENIR